MEWLSRTLSKEPTVLALLITLVVTIFFCGKKSVLKSFS